MRNQLDIQDLDGGIDGLVYWARGELDGAFVNVMAFALIGEVRVATKADLCVLSPDAASELAKHLDLAAKAIRQEVGRA